MSFFCWRPSCFFMTFRKFPMAQNCRTFVMLFSPLNCTRNDHKTFCCNFLRIGGILTGLIRARPVCLCCCGSVRRRTAMLIVDCDLLTIDRISSAQECVFIYCRLHCCFYWHLFVFVIHVQRNIRALRRCSLVGRGNAACTKNRSLTASSTVSRTTLTKVLARFL